jgi:hypothetical protein
MIPTITTESHNTVTIQNNSDGLKFTMRDVPSDDLALLDAIRKMPTINGMIVDDFFADIEDRRSPVIIRGTTYLWEQIAHLFHDLDGSV